MRPPAERPMPAPVSRHVSAPHRLGVSMNFEDGPNDVTVAERKTPGTAVPGTTAGEEAEQRPRLLLPSDPEFREIEQAAQESTGMSRRSVLRLGAPGGGGGGAGRR